MNKLKLFSYILLSVLGCEARDGRAAKPAKGV